MNSIENYKKRFNMLMESTLGNVKPLINEQNTKDDASLNYICNAIANYINQEIAKKRTTDPTFPDAKIEVVRSASKYQGEDDVVYSFKFNGVTIPMYGDNRLSVRGLSVDTPTTVKSYATSLKYSFDNMVGSKYTPNLPKTLRKLPSLFGPISKLVDTWAAQFQPAQPTKPGTKTPTQPK
jgi:hypothetical protein